MIHQFEQRGILAEEMPPDVTARLDRILLILAVHGFFHALEQQTGVVAGEQFIPIRAPDHLDHIPTRAAENTFEFLDDLAIAADGPIEPLQIAIHYPNEIVELFARRESELAERLGFVRFAIADEAPYAWLFLPSHEL